MSQLPRMTDLLTAKICVYNASVAIENLMNGPVTQPKSWLAQDTVVELQNAADVMLAYMHAAHDEHLRLVQVADFYWLQA